MARRGGGGPQKRERRPAGAKRRISKADDRNSKVFNPGPNETPAYSYAGKDPVTVYSGAAEECCYLLGAGIALLGVAAVDESTLDYIAEFAHALARREQQFIAKLQHQRRPLSPKQIVMLDQIIAVCMRAERET